MKRFLSASMVIICLFAIPGITTLPSVGAQTKTDGSNMLVKQWEIGQGLKVPESIVFSEPENVIYVSNINGKPMEKNGKGFISKISLNGDMIDLKWATGFNAPKGMAIFGRTLYVSDIDQLVAVDLETGGISKRYPAPGAIFLNDVAADDKGRVYVSDTSKQNSAIYRLAHGRLTQWLKNEAIKNPNGLFVEDGKLIVGNSGDGSLKIIRLADGSVQSVIKAGCGIDGLQPDGRGNFIISNWRGKTILINPSGKTTLLMDTTDQKINSADLVYLKKINLLIIPTFFDNRIVAYRLAS